MALKPFDKGRSRTVAIQKILPVEAHNIIQVDVMDDGPPSAERRREGYAEMRLPVRKFLNVEQVAEYLGVAKSWVYDRTSADRPDRIPHFKMGKYLRFDVDSEEFKTWLRSMSN